MEIASFLEGLLGVNILHAKTAEPVPQLQAHLPSKTHSGENKTRNLMGTAEPGAGLRQLTTRLGSQNLSPRQVLGGMSDVAVFSAKDDMKKRWKSASCMSTGSFNSEPVSPKGSSWKGSSSSQEGQPSRPSSRTGRSSSSGQSLSKATWRSFELFQELSQDDFTQCIKMMKVCTFKPSEKIFTKGTIGTTMYFIDVGSARVSIQGLTANFEGRKF